MSVFVRASLQGTPKTSPGHVALHHMPGLPMNLQHHFLRLGLQPPPSQPAKPPALTPAPALLAAAAKAQHR